MLDKQSQLMNSPCGDPNKELNHKEENQYIVLLIDKSLRVC